MVEDTEGKGMNKCEGCGEEGEGGQQDDPGTNRSLTLSLIGVTHFGLATDYDGVNFIVRIILFPSSSLHAVEFTVQEPHVRFHLLEC